MGGEHRLLTPASDLTVRTWGWDTNRSEPVVATPPPPPSHGPGSCPLEPQPPGGPVHPARPKEGARRREGEERAVRMFVNVLAPPPRFWQQPVPVGRAAPPRPLLFPGSRTTLPPWSPQAWGGDSSLLPGCLTPSWWFLGPCPDFNSFSVKPSAPASSFLLVSLTPPFPVCQERC